MHAFFPTMGGHVYHTLYKFIIVWLTTGASPWYITA